MKYCTYCIQYTSYSIEIEIFSIKVVNISGLSAYTSIRNLQYISYFTVWYITAYLAV